MDEPLRVLIVEDSEDDAFLMARVLQKGGYRLAQRRVDNPQAMAEALDRETWDIVISDYAMPAFDGMAALELLKEKDIDIPFIIVSGTIGEEVAVAVMKAGASDYVMKDKLARLVPAIEREIREAASRREHRRTEELLRQREQEAAILFNNLPAYVFYKNADSVYITANPQFCDAVGLTRDTIVGKTDHDIFSPALADKYRQDDRQVIESGEPLDVGLEEMLEGSRKRYVATRKVPLKDMSGTIIGLIGIGLDMTDHRRAEEERVKLQEQLRQAQKMEAIGQLAGGVAHDFNNLLTVIQGRAEMALMKLEGNDPLQRELEIIVEAASRASHLTRQLLLFARRQTMEMTSLDLNAAIQNLVKMLNRLIGEHLSLTTELSQDLKRVNGDIGAIEQIVMNLVVNARDAIIDSGSIAIRTENVQFDDAYCQTYREARPGEFVCLSVQDTGSGIAPDLLDRIFEPFFTTKEAGQGTGLGLAVAYGITKQHSGWIEVESEPGQGSVFKIFLPTAEAAETRHTKASLSPDELQGNGERILLIEDDEQVCGFTHRVLSQRGYQVFPARNAQQAREIFEQEAGSFDMVFSDIVLPGERGPDIVAGLLRQKPDLKVVFASGYSDEYSGWSVIQEKGYPYLQKPYSLLDLLSTIRKALET